MNLPSVITIDGPAASGKTTIGKKLADKLGYLFIDTGVMYRAVTWEALQRNLPLHEEAMISALANQIEIDIRPSSKLDGRNYDIFADGNDVTWQIRRAEVDDKVSLVSSYRGVREALSYQQRRIGMRGGVVMAGRDIGTVVMPEAEAKIFLNASVEERAARRFLEMQNRKESTNLESIQAAMLARDEFDSSRELAPLRPAQDAIVLNTDGLNIEEVFERVLQIIGTINASNENL